MTRGFKESYCFVISKPWYMPESHKRVSPLIRVSTAAVMFLNCGRMTVLPIPCAHMTNINTIITFSVIEDSLMVFSFFDASAADKRGGAQGKEFPLRAGGYSLISSEQ